MINSYNWDYTHLNAKEGTDILVGAKSFQFKKYKINDFGAVSELHLRLKAVFHSTPVIHSKLFAAIYIMEVLICLDLPHKGVTNKTL